MPPGCAGLGSLSAARLVRPRCCWSEKEDGAFASGGVVLVKRRPDVNQQWPPPINRRAGEFLCRHLQFPAAEPHLRLPRGAKVEDPRIAPLTCRSGIGYNESVAVTEIDLGNGALPTRATTSGCQ